MPEESKGPAGAAVHLGVAAVEGVYGGLVRVAVGPQQRELLDRCRRQRLREPALEQHHLAAVGAIGLALRNLAPKPR